MLNLWSGQCAQCHTSSSLEQDRLLHDGRFVHHGDSGQYLCSKNGTHSNDRFIVRYSYLVGNSPNEKNGVSAWSQLQSGWDGKHCRHLYQLFAAISAVLFILTMIAFGNAGHGDNDNSDDDIVAVADDEVMTEDEVEEVVIIDSVANPEEDVIVVEEPVKTKPQEQQTRKEESSDNNEPKSDKRANPAPASSDSEDYDKHERFLKEAIREGNKSFPQKAAEGMIMKRCYLDGDYVMYLAECDEDLYDMELLNLNKGDMKQGIKDMVRQNNDPQISYLVRLCIKAHKGIGFKYQGDTSGKSCIVRVPYSELKNL